jgi:spore maturation protein SpmA
VWQYWKNGKEHNMDWGKWFKAAGIRALKTVAQTAVGMLSGDLIGILEVNWISVLSVAATAGVLSLLTSLAGLPEVEQAHPPEK